MKEPNYCKVLQEYLDTKQADLIHDLSEFIKIESISNRPDKVNAALQFALNLAESFGFQSRAYLNGQVGVIEIGTGEEILGILSHVDVVEPGDPDKWNTNPFEPVIKEGRMYGRGTLDDKGALIACIYAMKAVSDLGEPFHKKVQLILGTQEEVKWTDMNAYVEEFRLPDYGFTPDGEFPVCNIEKGGADVTLAFPVEQPDDKVTDGRYLTYIEAGTAANVVPGTCIAEITEYRNGRSEKKRIKVLGRSVHSCQPEKGDNAIFKMADQLSGMALNENKLLKLLELSNQKLRDIFGNELGLYSDSEFYNGEFVHRNVITPTIFKVEDGTAKLNVNIRFSYGTEEKDLADAMKRFAAGNGGEVINFESLPAVYISKDKPFLKVFADAYEEMSGYKNEFVLAYGGSYAKAMPNIVSWGPIFPGEADTCHEENEYITIDSLMRNAKIFAAAISKIALTEKSFK
ncbi:MAG: Sapep family Mn(2+)-dependent dipeptidase [Eubacteriales bacterium]|nr:Sapep family Mn(2+)-dependent dipeptidase [Eubacteriales bacterium]